MARAPCARHVFIYQDWFGIDRQGACMLDALHQRHGLYVPFADLRAAAGIVSCTNLKHRIRQLDAAVEPGSIDFHPWNGARLTAQGMRECIIALRRPEYISGSQ